MRFNEYQHLAKQTAVGLAVGEGDPLDGLIYLTLGLAGESGEVVEKIKKAWRNGSTVEKDIVRELGDVLWYLAMIATKLGVDFSTVAEVNVDKLSDRQKRGVLRSEGDDR